MTTVICEHKHRLVLFSGPVPRQYARFYIFVCDQKRCGYWWRVDKTYFRSQLGFHRGS